MCLCVTAFGSRRLWCLCLCLHPVRYLPHHPVALHTPTIRFFCLPLTGRDVEHEMSRDGTISLYWVPQSSPVTLRGQSCMSRRLWCRALYRARRIGGGRLGILLSWIVLALILYCLICPPRLCSANIRCRPFDILV